MKREWERRQEMINDTSELINDAEAYADKMREDVRFPSAWINYPQGELTTVLLGMVVRQLQIVADKLDAINEQLIDAERRQR